MRFLFLFLLALSSLPGISQGKSLPSAGFRMDLSAGAITGNAYPAIQVQGIAGVRYKGFFAGFGGGWDKYEHPSSPVFFHLQKAFRHQKSSPFLYASGGWNLPKEKAREEFVRFKLHTGSYYDAGVGYRMVLGKRFNMMMSAGYSGKSYKEDRIFQFICPGGCSPTVYHYRFNLTRIGLKAGISMN